jgi:hypothetical protein
VRNVHVELIYSGSHISGNVFHPPFIVFVNPFILLHNTVMFYRPQASGKYSDSLHILRYFNYIYSNDRHEIYENEDYALLQLYLY